MSGNNTTAILNGTFPYPPTGPVGAWWTQMVVVAIFNLFFFAFTWYKTRTNLWVPPEERRLWSYRYSKWMRLLPIPFVIQTTWRAFLPSLYNSRRTIIPEDVNSVIIARTGAFIGEICWGIQIAWALRVIARHVPIRGADTMQKRLRTIIPWVTYYIVLAAVVGNICSVVGMITTNYIFVVVEETLWATIFLFGAICAMFLWYFACDHWTFGWGSNCFGVDMNPFDDPEKEFPRSLASVWVMRMFIRGYALFGIIATPYMVIVDVPKWYARWRNDENNGVQYLGFAEGLVDAATRQVPSQAYADWDQDFFWMSGYFSGAVWASIFLMYAPGRAAEDDGTSHDGHGSAHNQQTSGGPIVPSDV